GGRVFVGGSGSGGVGWKRGGSGVKGMAGKPGTEVLRFDLAICYTKILRFTVEDSCVLLKEYCVLPKSRSCVLSKKTAIDHSLCFVSIQDCLLRQHVLRQLLVYKDRSKFTSSRLHHLVLYQRIVRIVNAIEDIVLVQASVDDP
nr:hypothetical protein [Tanacetum cinerariifolium]